MNPCADAHASSSSHNPRVCLPFAVHIRRVSPRGNNDKVLMKHPTWSSGVLGTMLKFFEPIGQALKQLGASNYALDVRCLCAVAWWIFFLGSVAV